MKKKIIHFFLALAFYGLISYLSIYLFDKENPNPWFYIILWSVTMAFVDVFIFAKMKYALKNAKKIIDKDKD